MEESILDDDLEPVVNTSPIKKKGTSDKYIEAGIVVKKKASLDKEKLLESIAAVMSNLPEQEKESPEIVEMKGHFAIEFSHDCAVIVRRELEELLGLSVLPLLDAREGLKTISLDDPTMDTVTAPSEETTDKEISEVPPTDKFQDLIRKHEAASSGEEICVPALYVYSGPEDKNLEEYEESKKQRFTELENVCKSGPSNLCRAASVWKGVKEKEDLDRKWAEEKLKLLRSERNALKEGQPTAAKKWNYKMKLHEISRPLPDSKRKDTEKTGSSPNNKFLKTTSVTSKLSISSEDLK